MEVVTAGRLVLTRDGVQPKQVMTPDGNYRPHLRGVLGTDLLLGGRFDGNNDRQEWRCWAFPHIHSHEFFNKVIERLGGKAMGDAVWVDEVCWTPDGNDDMPNFRQHNYYDGNADWSKEGDPWEKRWWDGLLDGYYWGRNSGLIDGREEGSKRAQKKEKRAGNPTGKGKGGIAEDTDTGKDNRAGKGKGAGGKRKSGKGKNTT